MKNYLAFIFLFISSQVVFSQIDKNQDRTPSNNSIPAIKFDENSPANSSPFKSTYKSTNLHSLTSPKYRNGFANPTDFILNEDKKELSMKRGHGLKEHIIDFQPNYFGQKNDGGRGNQRTQDLGEFYASGKFVEIYCRDHQYVDGDKVQVKVNGNIVARSITLYADFQPVLVTLQPGRNHIEITALNVGASAPNTAQFIVYDENGQIITKNRWNLSTGVSAQMTIHKKP